MRLIANGLLVLVGMAAAGRAGADVPAPPSNAVFASAGVGGGSRGFGGMLSLSVNHDGWLYMARTAETEDLVFFGPTPSERDTDYALLLGRSLTNGRVLSSAALGLGVLKSVRRGAMIEPAGLFGGPSFQRIDRSSVGVAADFRTSVNFGFVGIGVALFGNVARHDSLFGMALTLQVGRLRPRKPGPAPPSR